MNPPPTSPAQVSNELMSEILKPHSTTPATDWGNFRPALSTTFIVCKIPSGIQTSVKFQTKYVQTDQQRTATTTTA